MQAITIKYLGPSNVRGSRYKAISASGKSVVISSDHSLNPEDNAIEAAKSLARKLGWSGTMILGGTKDGWVAVSASGESFAVGGSSKGGLNEARGRRNMTGRAAGVADADAAKELALFIENDGTLYRQQWQPILKNLANKRAQGKYDREKAIKLFMYLMESGAKKYAKDFGGTWNVLFSVPTRREAAKEFTLNFEHYDDEGTYDSDLTKVSAKARAASKSNRSGTRRARRA